MWRAFTFSFAWYQYVSVMILLPHVGSSLLWLRNPLSKCPGIRGDVSDARWTFVCKGHQMGGCDYSMFKLIWNGSFCFGCRNLRLGEALPWTDMESAFHYRTQDGCHLDQMASFKGFPFAQGTMLEVHVAKVGAPSHCVFYHLMILWLSDCHWNFLRVVLDIGNCMNLWEWTWMDTWTKTSPTCKTFQLNIT